jgi:DNA polymerase III delta subunit
MIFFFYGPNSYAARQQIAKLIAEYEKKTGSNFGLERIDGAKAKPEELNAALQAAPFLASSRLVVIEGLGSNPTVAATIGTAIAQVPATTVAVFYDPAVDQRTGYFKTLKDGAKAIKFEPLSTAKLQQWIVATARDQGAEIERPAVGRLLDLAGEDQWRLGHEIAKLAAYESPITTATVEELVEEGNTETIFNLVEATTAGKVETALRQYRRLRTEGLSEIYMLSMVIWQLRNLLLAGAAGKTTPAELAKAAGMSPFVAGKMLSKRHLFTEDQLKSAFLQAVDTDYQIKSGVGAADVLVEQLIYRLASRVTV